MASSFAQLTSVNGLREQTLMVGFGWWGRAKKGLSVDDEKQWKARRRDFARFEQTLGVPY